mmetsp:Transcript_21548/g.42320  ORF Transcript_21548/g.42320 Transcript_21548/m.42320 type:complete len:990 (-) Transcript_21548:94-3063(-)|eukprot:CAMPEP_0171492346 /NCGR_PEP_ID=MMETSP0958-20121227/4358_1 /TAXON_ID=87120 /ORGANISM="Aurantiochytrium limacinum, Strain ATCCMYA-1381" /LENGTH=989 /DNA_ID=CAMNT_0012025853 /DNA_START=232 /DNA_END=3201 /DNA_ORIENTATION=-
MSYTILLFYKYVDISKEAGTGKDGKSQLETVQEWIKDTAERLNLSGRVLLASEGINGNLASKGPEGVEEFCKGLMDLEPFKGKEIDFKLDTSELQPFPDMVIKIKSEICSTGHMIPKELIDAGKGGVHLSPKDFHETLKKYWESETKEGDKELIVLDVRNDCEFKTGRFMAPDGKQEAINPCTHTYAQWVPEYAAKNVGSWKDKKVLMYCTGGIRCEKASAYLRDKGCEDVSQLSGGIHRYLEEFGSNGYFKGSNFVFDSRALQKPEGAIVVGKCFNCEGLTEDISKDRVCAVCRCTILVCNDCRAKLMGVYYCDRHKFLQGAYEPFLDKFSDEELDKIVENMQKCWDECLVGSNIRRSIRRNMDRTKKFKEDRKAREAAEAAAAPELTDKASIAAAEKLNKRKQKQRAKWNTNPRCRSCGLLGPVDLLESMGRSFSDVDILCDGKCTGFQSEKYENPYRSLEQMNEPDFEETVRKIARERKAGNTKRSREENDTVDNGTTSANDKNTKRFRTETQSEFADVEYEKVEDPKTGKTLRHVKPYLYEYHTHTKQRWLGRKLLDVYSAEFSTHPVEYYKKAIEFGLIRVNGEKVTPDYELKSKDRIDNCVHRHEPDVQYLSANDMIIMENDEFVFVNKPASVSVHPSGSFRRNSLTFILATERNLTDLYPAHRLDRVTSGLVIICKNRETAAEVSDAMMRRNKESKDASSAGKIQKAYLARVHGRFPQDQESIQAHVAKLGDLEAAKAAIEKAEEVGKKPEGSSKSGLEGGEADKYLTAMDLPAPGVYIRKSEEVDLLDLEDLPGRNSDVVEVSWPLRCADAGNGVWEYVKPEDIASCPEDAKPSLSRFRVLGYDEASDSTLLQCEPATGRTHQLRLHLALLGHPICNDPNYGKDGNLTLIRADQADPDANVVKDLQNIEVMEDDEDKFRDAAAKALCVACTQGLNVAFKPIQMSTEGLDLHAYAYKIHLPKKEPIDCKTPVPEFAKAFASK